MKRHVLLSAGLALALVGTGGAATATAKPVFHDLVEFTFPFAPDCEGLDLVGEATVQAHLLVNARGPDGLAHWQAHIVWTDVITNLDNERTYSAEFRYTERNHEVTDNGDGTYTVQQRQTGRVHHHGPEGERLGVDAGQVSFELLFADDGPWPSGGTFLHMGPPTFVGRFHVVDRPLCEVLHEVLS